jgi:hypothetical protein
MRRIMIWVLAAAVPGVGAGCQTARPIASPDPGATGYAYVHGYAVQRFVYPAPLLRRAAVEAMTDMKINSVKEEARDDGVRFCGYMFDGRFVAVTIRAEGEASIMSVRFDVYGDEPLSKILLDRTSIRLSTLLPPVNPVFAPRAFSDSITHRGQDVAGYRGTPLR